MDKERPVRPIMDLHQLSKDLTDREFTDIELVLVDKNTQLSIHSHKLFLSFCSEYFKKLFKFGKEKNQTTITINVEDVIVGRDVIHSLYGITINPTNTKYLLQVIKCRNFFCLPNNCELLYNIEIVNDEEFDLFLEVVDMLNISDEKIISVIKKNIPENYDLKKFSVDFVKKLLESNAYVIASGGNDDLIYIWDINESSPLMKLAPENLYVEHLLYSPDGKILLSAGWYQDIKVWNTTTGCLKNTLLGHNSRIYGLSFSPNNKMIVSCSHDCTIKLWDAETCILNKTLDGFGYVYSVVFSPCSTKIISGHTNEIIIWDISTFTVTKHIATNRLHIYDLSISSDGSKILARHCAGFINIYDWESGNFLFELKTLDGHVYSVLFFKNDQIIYSDGRIIKVYDINNDLVVMSLTGHRDEVLGIAVSHDKKIIASASADMTIKIWDARTGGLIKTLSRHIKSVNTLSFKPEFRKDINAKLEEYLNSFNN